MVKMYANGITKFVNETEVDMMLRAGYVVVEDPKPEPEQAPEVPAETEVKPKSKK